MPPHFSFEGRLPLLIRNKTPCKLSTEGLAVHRRDCAKHFDESGEGKYHGRAWRLTLVVLSPSLSSDNISQMKAVFSNLLRVIGWLSIRCLCEFGLFIIPFVSTSTHLFVALLASVRRSLHSASSEEN